MFISCGLSGRHPLPPSSQTAYREGKMLLTLGWDPLPCVPEGHMVPTCPMHLHQSDPSSICTMLCAALLRRPRHLLSCTRARRLLSLGPGQRGPPQPCEGTVGAWCWTEPRRAQKSVVLILTFMYQHPHPSKLMPQVPSPRGFPCRRFREEGGAPLGQCRQREGLHHHLGAKGKGSARGGESCSGLSTKGESQSNHALPSHSFTDAACSLAWSSPRIHTSSHKGLSAIPHRAKW